LELAYLHMQLPKVVSPDTKVVELAVGDGTLSEKIYPLGTEIVAVDISPYSLRLPAAMPHVKQAVVSDCLNPAIRSGSFDLLVTNNFLHHVTDKSAVLDHIARVRYFFLILARASHSGPLLGLAISFARIARRYCRWTCAAPAVAGSSIR
jgi:SAM-dependent methyltransferase